MNPVKKTKGKKVLQTPFLRKIGDGKGALAMPEDRLVDTAYRVLIHYFEKMCDQEAGTRQGVKLEPLHDMRVAIRRLRTALKIFNRVLPAASVAFFGTELRWIFGVLGPARDADVYLENLSKSFDELKPSESKVVQPYRKDLMAGRKAAHKQMIEALDSKRFDRWVVRFQDFLKHGPPRNSKARMASLPVVEAAHVIIQQVMDETERRGQRAIDKTTARRLHQLRISIKRLRYTCEWFRGLFDIRFDQLIRKAIRLQSLLGEHHDAVETVRKLQESVAEVRKKGKHADCLLFMLNQWIVRQRRRIEAAEKQFPKKWRKFNRKRVRKKFLIAPIQKALKDIPKSERKKDNC